MKHSQIFILEKVVRIYKYHLVKTLLQTQSYSSLSQHWKNIFFDESNSLTFISIQQYILERRLSYY